MRAHPVTSVWSSGAYLSSPNVTLEGTPSATLPAAPHWSACMSGSNTISTLLKNSLVACHKRKPPAGGVPQL